MTAFWLQDPTVLFNNAGITQIIPTADMTREAKMNAISRLIIVLSILGYLVTMSYSVLLLGVVSLGVIAILNNATEINKTKAKINPQRRRASQTTTRAAGARWRTNPPRPASRFRRPRRKTRS